MSMAALLSELFYLRVLLFLLWLSVFAFGENLLSCENNSQDALGYKCNGSSQEKCHTYAILHTNSFYSSLFNLSYYLGINRFMLAEANGISPDTEFLPKDQPLLIPIECNCIDGYFEADLMKISIKGESFYSISESLEGLTTCRAIQAKNPGVSAKDLGDKIRLLVPLRCACPSMSKFSPETRFLLSYPVREGDNISKLALEFNTSGPAIISANKIVQGNCKSQGLMPLTSLLIPLTSERLIGPPAEPSEPNSRVPAPGDPVFIRKRKHLRKKAIYIVISAVLFGASVAVAAAFFIIQWKRNKQNMMWKAKTGELELQQLSLSVRTTSDKKVSFEGSQGTLDSQIMNNTPRKMLVEIYTIEELKKATEDFNSCYHIEGSVYHGLLKGKNLAIRRIQSENILKIDFGLFNDTFHHHPNLIRLYGTCLSEGPDSFLVFEYAKNGSLKDWLHGGLAIKNQFIASCYCFLTWNQRLRICLDVAMALQYMHQVMVPAYVHRNIKSRNIFLDEELGAKLGNFGMARCAEDDLEDPQFYATNPASWSLGYLAPEYVHQGIISPSIDIFAFGVVLLEVLSGQTPISRPNEKGDGSVWLAEKIKSVMQSNNADELKGWMDSALCENFCLDSAIILANLAMACTDEDPSIRPNAREIVEKLSKLVEELPEGEQYLLSESSVKPLVEAAASNL